MATNPAPPLKRPKIESIIAIQSSITVVFERSAAETTKTCLLIGYVDSNKSASTHVNYIGTETEPNIVSGGTLTIGSTTTTITEDNYLTYALPWGTGALINSNIKHNTIWQ